MVWSTIRAWCRSKVKDGRKRIVRSPHPSISTPVQDEFCGQRTLKRYEAPPPPPPTTSKSHTFRIRTPPLGSIPPLYRVRPSFPESAARTEPSSPPPKIRYSTDTQSLMSTVRIIQIQYCTLLAGWRTNEEISSRGAQQSFYGNGYIMAFFHEIFHNTYKL